MKKYIFTLIAVLLFSGAAFGVASNRVYFYLDVLDQWGDKITSVTQIDVQNESGVAVAVYSTKSGTTEVGTTGVITTNISDGSIEFWYADTAIDLTVTDGTRSYEIESFGAREHRFMLPDFLTATSGSTYGQTDDIDFTFGSWIIDGDTTNRLDMIPDNDGAVLGIGDGTAQADVYIYKSSSAYAFFDEGNGILELVDYDIDLDDNSVQRYGTGNDFSVYSDTANILEIDPASAGNELRLGTSFSDAIDVTWYGDLTGDTVTFDEENCEVLFTDINLQFDDDADAIFGSDDDFVIESDTAKTLEILPGAATDDYAVNIGLDQSGVDLKVFGATTGEYWMYDAGNDTITANTGNALYTMTDAEVNQFKVDATGTAAGFAIVFETTNGGFQVNADGADNGDITLDAADVLTLTSVDTKIFDGAAAETWVIEGTANDYEATVVFTDPTADVTYTIPVMAADTVAFMLSTLATNAPEIVNSVTGGTNQLIFEGTADALETIVTATDATGADKTITLPDATGTVMVRSYTAHAANSNIDASSMWGGVHTNTGASGATEHEMASAVAGMEFTFFATVRCPVSLDAATGDQILYLTDTVADKITSVGDVGNYVTLYAIDNTNWVQLAISCPVWSDGGA